MADEGYQIPTPIQKQAIPAMLEGKDLLGIAQTGTGKTAAFALPIMQRLDGSGRAREPRAPRALVLAPTRELAIQVKDSFVNYGRHMPLRIACIFGGVGDHPQKEALARGVDVLVATPGRLLDLMGQGSLHLRNLEVFVLDEADRMLDMGFIHDIRKVVAKLPPVRQNLFFSATMPDDIARLAATILRHPVRVQVAPANTPIELIDQQLYFVDRKAKPVLLRALLQDPSITRTLVFTRTKHGANKVCEGLQRAGINAAAIHGNKSQNRRQEALGGFQAGKIRVLVATDIAARGIDVEEISHVFNYDIPEVPETYVHRIGRTARAGAAGNAVAFCSPEEKSDLASIERLIRRTIPRADAAALLKEATAAGWFTPAAAPSLSPGHQARHGGHHQPHHDSHHQPRHGGHQPAHPPRHHHPSPPHHRPAPAPKPVQHSWGR